MQNQVSSLGLDHYRCKQLHRRNVYVCAYWKLGISSVFNSCNLITSLACVNICIKNNKKKTEFLNKFSFGDITYCWSAYGTYISGTGFGGIYSDSPSPTDSETRKEHKSLYSEKLLYNSSSDNDTEEEIVIFNSLDDVADSKKDEEV